MFQILSGAFLAGAARYILAALGFGVVTFVGTEALLSQLSNYAQGQLGSAGGAVTGLAGLMGVPQAISLIVSAYSVRMATVALKKFRLL